MVDPTKEVIGQPSRGTETASFSRFPRLSEGRGVLPLTSAMGARFGYLRSMGFY
jgi:hypothetical protein